MKRKMKLLFFFGLTALFFAISTIDALALNETRFEIKHYKSCTEEKYEIFGLKNYRRKKTRSKELDTILEEYPVDEETFNYSENIYLSINSLYSTVSDKQMYDTGGYGGSSSLYENVSYSDSEGYLTKVLIVYDRGTVGSGEKLFEAVAFVNFHKKFKTRNTDSLVIWSGYNSVIEYNYSQGGYFDYDIFYGNSFNSAVRIIADNDYSTNNGVRYDFKLPNETSNVINPRNWYCEGNYYFVATGTTSVNSAYIHNEQWFNMDISISIGPAGLSISGRYTQYNGMGITIYV